MKNSVLVSIFAIASTCAAQFDPEQCGPLAGNQKCRQNKCCSQYGWCGTSNAYCQATRGCQPGFGRCTGVLSTSKSSTSSRTVQSSSAIASPSASAASISKNGRCGSAFGGLTCIGSTFGNCCSQYNWCGKTSLHCKVSSGCQLAFGTCVGIQSSSISTSVSPSSSQTSLSRSVVNAPSQASSTASPSSLTAVSSSVSQSSLTVASSASSSALSQVSANAPSSSLATGSSTSSITSSAISSAAPSSTTAASPSTSLSSTNTVTASLSASASPSAGGIPRVLHAARDPAVVRTAPENLVPRNAVSFYFAEDGTSYTTSVKANLDSAALGILLENIASLSSVTCSGSTINLEFTDATSANTARNWPAGTILFTLSAGCNSATERGVYRLSAATITTSILAPPRLRARVTSAPQNTNVWAISLEALLIQMDSVVENYDSLKRAAAETAAAASSTSILNDVTVLPLSSTVSSIVVSSSTAGSPSASSSSLPACGGYAPGGRFDIAGTTYQVSCTLAGTWRSIWIDISYQSSFTDCMAFCNQNSQCVAASYNEAEIRNGKYMCLRWPLLPYKTDNAENAPLAVKVVPVSSPTSSSTQ